MCRERNYREWYLLLLWARLRRYWIIEIIPYLCIRIRPAQYEVLSSYLSGLVVLAGLFLYKALKSCRKCRTYFLSLNSAGRKSQWRSFRILRGWRWCQDIGVAGVLRRCIGSAASFGVKPFFAETWNGRCCLSVWLSAFCLVTCVASPLMKGGSSAINIL